MFPVGNGFKICRGGEPPLATTIRRKRLTLYVYVNLLSLSGTKEQCRDGHWPSLDNRTKREREKEGKGERGIERKGQRFCCPCFWLFILRVPRDEITEFQRFCVVIALKALDIVLLENIPHALSLDSLDADLSAECCSYAYE